MPISRQPSGGSGGKGVYNVTVALGNGGLEGVRDTRRQPDSCDSWLGCEGAEEAAAAASRRHLGNAFLESNSPNTACVQVASTLQLRHLNAELGTKEVIRRIETHNKHTDTKHTDIWA